MFKSSHPATRGRAFRAEKSRAVCHSAQGVQRDFVRKCKGANSVRTHTAGVASHHANRRRRGNPLGGEFYTLLTVELDFPIAGALGGAVFTDAGNLPGKSDVSLDDMQSVVGAGLRYQLLSGPMRLDYGCNPARKAGDSPGAFHLSFGFAF